MSSPASDRARYDSRQRRWSGSAGEAHDGPAHLLPRVHPEAEPRRECCLLANLNSFAYDYVARQKVGSVHLNFFIVEQLPTLPPDTYADKCPWAKRETLEHWISERVLKLVVLIWLQLMIRWSLPRFRYDQIMQLCWKLLLPLSLLNILLTGVAILASGELHYHRSGVNQHSLYTVFLPLPCGSDPPVGIGLQIFGRCRERLKLYPALDTEWGGDPPHHHQILWRTAVRPIRRPAAACQAA